MQSVLVANRKGGCGKTLVAVTLAAALAGTGARVALADADKQKSALRWLKLRPEAAAPVKGLDWTRGIGEAPKKTDWLVIDAPGALTGAKAEALIAEARAIIVPVLPSMFDAHATKRFLKDIAEVKRVRKGKAEIHLLANRVRAASRGSARLRAFFEDLGQEPLAWISERTAYPDLAAQGLAVADKPQRAFLPLRAQWDPVLAKF
ncbi:MAG: ParA family protein [Pseudomonadota bacterium]